MKIIQKISLLLVLLITTQACNLFALPGRGGGSSRNANVQRSNTATRSNALPQRDTRSFGENTHQSARGVAISKNRNNEPQKGDAAGKIAIAAHARNNNQYIDDNSDDYADDYSNEETSDSTSSQESQSQDETIDQMPIMQSEHQNFFDTTSTVNPQKTTFTPDNQHNIQQATMQTPTQQEYSSKKSSSITPQMAIPDQNEILHKLKVINTINDKNHNLISESSLAQLFNNFVYFKNFIVSNFEKDKIMKLAQEFINQIYPQEKASSITIATTNKNGSTASSQTPTPVTSEPMLTHQENQYNDQITVSEENFSANEEQSYPDETFQEYDQHEQQYPDDAILNEEEFEYVTDESFEE